MPRHTFYAYVDGCDLDAIAPAVEARLNAFVVSHQWISGEPWVVNQRRHGATRTHSSDLEEWDLGLNLELPDVGAEQQGWFTYVERIAQFLAGLHTEFGRDFVIGISDATTSISEDLFDISTPQADLDMLRRVIGVGDIA